MGETNIINDLNQFNQNEKKNQQQQQQQHERQRQHIEWLIKRCPIFIFHKSINV